MKAPKVKQMLRPSGSAAPNQFIIECENGVAFQSYDVIVANKYFSNGKVIVQLDEKYWNYSVSTSRYRNQFLGMNTKEVKEKINSGEIQLVKLN